jgi:nucleoid-associated protein YgaU
MKKYVNMTEEAVMAVKTFVVKNTLFDGLKYAVAAVVLLCAGVLYGQTPDAPYTPEPAAELDRDVPEPARQGENGEISYNLRRNKYFLESLSLKNQANLAIAEGEYEQAEELSAEAVRYAALSDEYIAEQLKRGRAFNAIGDARAHIAWAKNAEALKYYPAEYEMANGHLQAALAAFEAEDFDGALENAMLVGEDLAGVAAPPAADDAALADMPKFPSKYTVRPWDKFGDCFWNIALWFYGDHYKWPLLYEANKEKLPDINNPDLLEVGTVIDIPEAGDETRTGMWDSGKPYKR